MAKLKGKSRDEVTRSRSWSLRSLCMWRYGAALRPIKIRVGISQQGAAD